ncbi:MAG: FAD-dependent monooxygenase [Rubripirellula sp.]
MPSPGRKRSLESLMVVRTDVLICGAGPVGLTLATQLRAMGVSCQIVDKNRGRSCKSKALVVWGRSLEVLHTCMDANAFLSVGRPVRKARFYEEGAPFAEIEFTSNDSQFGTGVLIPQSLTEKLLEDHLNVGGLHVERSTELISFVQSSDSVSCVLQDAGGGQRAVVAKYLVGCDGAHSVVRHGLGLEFPGRNDGLRWVLADVELSGEVPKVDVASLWSRSGILLLFHFGDNLWRVVAEEPLVSPESPRREPTLQEIQRYLDERGTGGVRAANPAWLAEFRVNERKVAHYAVGRVFLAGDSAHVHSPAGGQGMNTGIQDACNLAWKLAWHIRGVGSERLLRSYSAERGEIGAMVVRATSRITRLATTESRVLQRVRNTVAKIALHFDWVHDKVRKNLAEYTVSYRTSEINGKDARCSRAALRCGDRVPDIRWRDALEQTKTLYGSLAGGKAVLLILKSSHDFAFATWGQGIRGAGQSWVKVELVVTCESCVTLEQELKPRGSSEVVASDVSCGCIKRGEFEKLGSVADVWMLVRPDGYLVAAGQTEDLQPVAEWFSTVASVG